MKMRQSQWFEYEITLSGMVPPEGAAGQSGQQEGPSLRIQSRPHTTTVAVVAAARVVVPAAFFTSKTILAPNPWRP